MRVLSHLEQIGDPGSHVLILSRYRFSLKDVPRNWPGLHIEATTVHSAKGLEADYVIVMDLVCDRYGFPSKIEDDPLMSLVVPKCDAFPDGEERRLFYVALTRARKQAFLLTDPTRISDFVTELQVMCSDGTIAWLGNPLNPVQCGACGGSLVKRDGQYGEFYGCANYPWCPGKGKPCPACNKGILVAAINADLVGCSEIGCDFLTQRCAQCSGYLTRREGKFGAFYGCSNFAAGDCRYTAQVLTIDQRNLSDIKTSLKTAYVDQCHFGMDEL